MRTKNPDDAMLDLERAALAFARAGTMLEQERARSELANASLHFVQALEAAVSGNEGPVVEMFDDEPTVDMTMRI